MPLKKYERLLKLSKQSHLLHSIQMMLEWDQETYLPPGSAEFRAEQLEAMALLVHKTRTSSQIGKLIESIDSSTFTEIQKRNLAEIKRAYLMEKKLPASFQKKWAKTTSEALIAWPKAKKENKFSHFLPHLKKIVTLNQKKAELLEFKEHPYDALLNLFEPNLTTAQLTSLFTELKKGILPLLEKIKQKSPPSKKILEGDYSTEMQLKTGNQILASMGLPKDQWRLDLTNHPFCMGVHPTDTRLTTRVHEDNFVSNLYAVLHEGGHGLYNAGRPKEYYGTPHGTQGSLGVDESQSRFWEIFIGKSLPFAKWMVPQLAQQFGAPFSHASPEDYFYAVNTIAPSFIRIEADELTYHMHILLRFELEKELIEGTLSPKDIPLKWNEKMEQFLGITPPNNSLGCLQDIHWAMGAIGYFPTYTLGTLFAAQLFATFQKEFPSWQEEVSKGKFLFITEWLKEKVHKHGSLYHLNELCEMICREPLNPKYLLEHLERKIFN